MNKLITLLLLSTLALSGCESMTVAECQVADWGRVGYADGARGESESRLAAYSEDCGKAGVRPNAQAYRQGWDAGIVRYCTAANGWREGLLGNGSRALACQGRAGYDAFSYYLAAGLEVYRTSEMMRQNADFANRLQRRLEESGNDDERRRLRDELRDVDHEQYRLRGLLMYQQTLAP